MLPMNRTFEELQDLGRRYTAAWSSQSPARVAGFYAENGTLTINGAAPSVGREEIGKAAEGFMTAFPDLALTMNQVRAEGNGAVFCWTLAGHNSGPGGSGRYVIISGFEEWEPTADGLIACSKGHFDDADYQRQLAIGFEETRR